MASVHVLFDPKNRGISFGPAGASLGGACFVSLVVPDLIEDPAEIADLASKLATLLFEQMKPAAPADPHPE